jgi:hypothetical protein
VLVLVVVLVIGICLAGHRTRIPIGSPHRNEFDNENENDDEDDCWVARMGARYPVMTFSACGNTSKRTGVVPIGCPSTCTDKRLPDEISTLFAENISIFGL